MRRKLSFLFFFTLCLTLLGGEKERDFTINLKNIERVDLNLNHVSIKVSSYDGKKIKIIRKNNKNKFFLRGTTANGNYLVVLYPLKKKKNSFFRTKLQILLPKDRKIPFFINLKNSNLYILNLTGDIEVSGDNNYISAKEIKGNFRFQGKNTKVKVSNISGTTYIDTTLKSIRGRKLFKISKLKTSYASIFAQFSDISSDSAQIISSHGSINLQVEYPRNFDYDFYGDLIEVKDKTHKVKSDRVIILGTSNGTIYIHE